MAAVRGNRAAQRVLLLGAPGVGKGTYARRLEPVLQARHVVAGDLVRTEIKQRSPVGLEIAALAARGDLVPDRVVLDLLRSHLCAQRLMNGGFILDGVPRTLAQAREVDKMLQPDLALHLTMDADIVLLKMAARRLDEDGNVYNIAYINRGGWDMPPLLPQPPVYNGGTGELTCAHGVTLERNALVECPLCLSGLRRRDDDREEVCRHRLKVYEESAKDLIAHYSPIRLDFHIEGGVHETFPKLVAALQDAGAAILEEPMPTL